jgi:hypothetical protein
MRPEILRMVIQAMKPGQPMSASEIRNRGKFRNLDLLQRWLEDLVCAELVERIEVKKESDGRPGRPVEVNYRLKYVEVN